uniref:uncharacterized protein LOC131127563 isoform X2 n=1 Tax=Doryrhamphus excisus TaxID=161450 RepID=UPI0025ADA1D2|nr:uncharacterized protein LOC131127563 isoform X2 [Doryrhamphus excisus]
MHYNRVLCTGVKVQKKTEDMFNRVNSRSLTTGTDGYCEKHDSIEDESTSDDSISLLSELNPIQSRGKMEESGFILATDSNEQTNKGGINQLNSHPRIDLGNMSEYGVDDADNANHCQHGNIHKRDGNADDLIHAACTRDVAYDQIPQAGANVSVEDIAALHEASAQGNVVKELFNTGVNAIVQSQDNAVFSGQDQLNHSVPISQILAAVEKKQKEMSTWSLTQPQDGVKYYSAVTHIHNTLAEVLVKQRLEKAKLAHKYKSMTSSILRHGVKIQLISLSSRQRNFVRILQMQMDLVMPPHMSRCTTSHQNSQSLLAQDSSSEMTETVKGSQDKSDQLISKSRPRRSSRQKAMTQTNGRILTVLPSHFPSTAQLTTKRRVSQPGNSLQANKIQAKDNAPLSQTRTDKHGRHLSQLVQKGLIPSGGALQLLLKGDWHFARVLEDGSIKDSKGKSHLSPECWLRSILANNIPVSCTYAWDKVSDQGASEAHVQRYSHGCTQETPTTGQNHLPAIRTLYLVADEELIPNSIIDSYWKRLLQSDVPQF